MLTDEEALGEVLAAGITQEQIDSIVRSRVARERERLAEQLELLRAVKWDIVSPGDPLGEDYPLGTPRKITDKDLTSAERVRLAAVAKVRGLLAAGIEEAEIRSATVYGLARRLRDGDLEAVSFTLDRAIAYERRAQSAQAPATSSTSEHQESPS